MKRLTLVSTWIRKPPLEEAIRNENADAVPRESLFNILLDSDILDGSFADRSQGIRRLLYQVLPDDIGQVLEAYFLRTRYRLIISWTDVGALLLALAMKVTRSRTPHIAMMFWISKPKKAELLRRVHTHIDRIILWTSAHRDFAIKVLKIPESKIVYIPHYVDQKFWSPRPAATDTICSAGREMRDYPTLVKAMQDVPSIPCHIATGNLRGTLEPTVKAIYENGPLPHNVTVGKLSPKELRDLYARSRFVVVPLLPTDSDNGLNVILEAFAMSKPVICTRTKGQTDVIEEGKTGIFVPAGDPEALRSAILRLWNDPAEAERMGRAGREFIERRHTLDGFVARVRQVAEEVELEHAR